MATKRLGKQPKSTLTNSRYLLGDFKFLEKLIEFNVDVVDEKKFIRLRNFYFTNKEFNLKNCLKISTAASQIF